MSEFLIAKGEKFTRLRRYEFVHTETNTRFFIDVHEILTGDASEGRFEAMPRGSETMSAGNEIRGHGESADEAAKDYLRKVTGKTGDTIFDSGD